jgi:hypothetical protein
MLIDRIAFMFIERGGRQLVDKAVEDVAARNGATFDHRDGVGDRLGQLQATMG